ncbi:hypothetical protein WJX73_003180 [Symbiochloris irregularis]|uniref:Uncharacterized protein n=1 Tax=Symbiochloris irregularis TaxID=706552 RepID=A0AAW1NUJ3_9CHLO
MQKVRFLQPGPQRCFQARKHSSWAARAPGHAAGRSWLRSRFLAVGQSRGTAHASEEAKDADNPLIRVSVGAATAVLDLFRGSRGQAGPKARSAPASSLDEMLFHLREDFEQHAYFVTGDINEALYDADCLFEEPTIRFSGLKKWQRNLKLLVPFFVEPTIDLKRLEIVSSSPPQLQAAWRLRTQLKLPWKPLVDVGGCTDYLVDPDTMQIVRHVEAWDVSPLQAIMQIFRPPPKQ